VDEAIVVTTQPFGEADPEVLDLIASGDGAWRVAQRGRDERTPEAVLKALGDARVVIAGTEPYPAEVIAAAPRLEAICRVGIGLDNVDLLAARERGVAVSYTPDGPSAAVAELTVGLMLDLLRGVTRADRSLRAGRWERLSGERLALSTVGLVGLGRIGSRVARHLAAGFPGVRILANDIDPDHGLDDVVSWVGFDELVASADIVSLHVPLSPDTLGMVGIRELEAMRPSAGLINTARGGIVDEEALARALREGQIRAAAVDVFVEEPYDGPLTEVPNVLLTCHMGSMTSDCRGRMEREAVEDALRFLGGRELLRPVPEEEYEMAALARHRAR
jgi:D-3-phosphoglycerate dehydrogenase / 2-oxoglutarate reductase